MKSALRVSLVLPAYNESAYLRECLEAIAHQTTKPYEVIVVDNNSTDDTVAIARSFPFVKIVHESRQGILHARAAGFNVARGEIIGRIDCDTIIPPDWIQTVRELFAESDVAALSGTMHYGDTALQPVINKADLFVRRWLARNFARTNTVFLQGASMAIRRDAWHAVRGSLCSRVDIHEDYDIALHLQELAYKVEFAERLIARVSLRRIDASLAEVLRYSNASPHSYMVHDAPGWMRMYAVIGLVLVAYVPVRILYRGYDVDTGRFSFARLFVQTETRISPVSYLEKF